MKVTLANPATRERLNKRYERYYIKAGSRWPWSYKKRILDRCTPPFPFFLAYAAAVLRDEGHEPSVIDGVALNIGDETFIKRIERNSPDILVLEPAMHTFLKDMRLCERIRSRLNRLTIILAGPHATIFAASILETYPFIDVVLTGEYEFTLAAVVRRLSRGERDLSMNGAAFRRNGSIFIPPQKGFIENINRLPRPAFELFPSNDHPDMTRYGDGIATLSPFITLHASRGCPFRCDFCLWNQVMYGNRKYRVFSPLRVADEMEYVIGKFGAREIYFDDDDFCVRKEHVLSICEEIRRRKMPIRWSCMGDAMSCDEEMIRVMSRSGCIFMKFGVESGNREILRSIGKPLDPERAVQVARWCRRYGMMTHGTFVFGLYGDTPATMRETLKLANRIPFDYAQASIATPFPGTRLHDKLVKRGAIKNPDASLFDGTRSCAFETEHLTAEEIVSFRRKAILSMILHKAMDPGWWKNYIRRNGLLLKNYGMEPVLTPIRSLMRL